MTKEETLKQTLEAFEALIDKFSDVSAYEDEEHAFTDELILIPDIKKAIKAIAAAKEALAQPEQEPEYWNVIDPAGNIVASETDAIRGWASIAGSYKPTVEGLLGFHDQGWRVLPKVTPPLPVQLVTWTGNGSAERRNIEAPRGYFFQVDRRLEEDDDTQVYKKPWVNLKDEEIDAIERLHWDGRPDLWGLRKFIREIEAKLKEKNT